MSEKKTIERHRGIEHVIYISMWLVVVIFPLINELIQASRGQDFTWNDILWRWKGMIPFLVLFLIHNYVLIPQLLLDRKIKKYSAGVLLLLGTFFIYEYVAHLFIVGSVLPHPGPPDLPPPHFSMAMPVILNDLLGMLMLGFNLAIVLLFKYQREQENRKVLDSIRLQEELKYLKAQINPHFFMNMLNNIHAMIDVDQVKAQEMILELSKLMRYVLYEGESPMTTFANEVKFISSYVALMRQRYPSDKVEIELNVPNNPSDKVKLPPLLFIAFVENAFKHGISYRRKSHIRICVSEEGGKIYFFCRNTKTETASADASSGGVGLENIKRRLNLLYCGKSALRIEDGSDYYTVNMIIPCL